MMKKPVELSDKEMDKLLEKLKIAALDWRQEFRDSRELMDKGNSD